MAPARLTIVMNYRSPFCALVVDDLFELARRHRVEIDWRIVVEVPRPSSLPITEDNPRFQYNRQDCQRRAEWSGLAWNPPAWRLTDVLAASRLGRWLQSTGSPLFESYSRRIVRAYWSDGHNISDPAVVSLIAAEVGISPSDLAAAAAATAEIDDDLLENARWCEEQGVLGVPYFQIGEQRFWGSDRIGAVDRVLAAQRLGQASDLFDVGVLFRQDPPPVVPVAGHEAGVAINRIFCVGRNYSEHAREMGADPTREAPFFFMKPSDALVLSGASIPYPPGTSRYEFEMELVVIVGKAAQDVSVEEAQASVFGYAAGLDMTRRDLQLEARGKGRPWELGKSFAQSAVVGPIKAVEDLLHPPTGRIALAVNGELKQSSMISDMIWSVPEILSNLSHYYTLLPGDMIFTGTPAGVGPAVPGDDLRGEIAGVGEVMARIIGAELPPVHASSDIAGLELTA